MQDLHAAFFGHHLLGAQQHTQSGGGDVLQLLKVQDQAVRAVQRGLELRLELGRGGGVQAALQGDRQGVSVEFLFDIQQFGFLLFFLKRRRRLVSPLSRAYNNRVIILLHPNKINNYLKLIILKNKKAPQNSGVFITR